ncbi:MAG: hypothetical protein WDZ49_10040 [Litorilinea sp.]
MRTQGYYGVLVWGFVLALGIALPGAWPAPVAAQSAPATAGQDSATGTAAILSEFTLNNPPGNLENRVAESEDYATVVLGNPWDMEQSIDMRPIGPMNRNPNNGFRDVSFQNGIFRGVTISHDSYFWLLHQGYPLANNIKPYSGLGAPIDAARFSQMSFRMARNGAGPNVPIRVYWYKAGDESTGQPSGMSVPLTGQDGWNVYNLDLSNPANVATGSWSGEITGLRIDPTSTSMATVTGVEIRLDWARLINPQTTARSEIAWNSNLQNGSSSVVSVALVENNARQQPALVYTVASGISHQASGSLDWDTQGLPPGEYQVRAQMGIDYAGNVLENPWDFDGAHDMARMDNFNNVSLQGSVFRGQSATNDSQMLMRIDPNQPIDTSLYRYLAVRINTSEIAYVNAMWTRAGDPGPWGGTTQFTLIDPGWQTLLIDLKDPQNIAAGAWSGTVLEFRLDPVTEPDVNVQIDWVGLLTANATPQSAADLAPIVSYAQNPVEINAAPVIEILAPSMASGDDYATTVLGKPWNFRDSSSVVRTDELVNISYGPQGMQATVQEGLHSGCLADCGDPQVWLRVGADPSQYIDAERFKYVTVRYWQEGWQDVLGGWAFRLLWTPTMFPNDTSTLDDVITLDGWPSYGAQEGWHTYQFNLQEMQLEPEGAILGQSNPGWNNARGRIAQFRFDPTEVAYASTFHLDQILLTSDPVARGRTTIRWNVKNADHPTTVRLYYTQAASGSEAQAAGSNDTLIATVQPGKESHVWDTAGVAQGTYYIKFVADDGYNTSTWYSEVPIIVAASRVDSAKHRIFAPAMLR